MASVSTNRVKFLYENYLAAKIDGLTTGIYDIEPVEEDNYEEYYILLYNTNGVYKGQRHVLNMRTSYGSNEVYHYPISPPNLKFLTKIFHANVSQNSGSICLDILKQRDLWMPTYDFTKIIMSIIALLQEPNPSSPLNSIAGELFKTCNEVYTKECKKVKYNVNDINIIQERCFAEFTVESNKIYNSVKTDYSRWFPQLQNEDIKTTNDDILNELKNTYEHIRKSHEKKPKPKQKMKKKTRFSKWAKIKKINVISQTDDEKNE